MFHSMSWQVRLGQTWELHISHLRRVYTTCRDGYFRICKKDGPLGRFASEGYSRGILLPQGYADDDFASKVADRRSVSGGTVMSGGDVLSWFPKTEECVALSTTEAEYVVLGDVAEEVGFFRRFGVSLCHR